MAQLLPDGENNKPLTHLDGQMCYYLHTYPIILGSSNLPTSA